jgi:GNAT superfamily N-acetyltransferase
MAGELQKNGSRALTPSSWFTFTNGMKVRGCTMLIRHARPADAERLSALAMRTFIDTFGGDNRPEDMALHCRLSYSPARQRKEIDNPGWTTLVCEESGELVGYAQLRQEEFPPCVGSDSAGEILCFYLDKAWHGRGLAHRLMVACLDAFRRKGRGGRMARRLGAQSQGHRLLRQGGIPGGGRAYLSAR